MQLSEQQPALAGAGPPSISAASSCAQLLGLRRCGAASSASNRSRGAASLLGLQRSTESSPAPGRNKCQRKSSTSHAAASLLGLKASAQDGLSGAPAAPETNLDDLAPYDAGDLYKCPCGWRPPPRPNSSQVKVRAKAHWRQCQGTLPPAAKTVGMRRRLAAKNTPRMKLKRKERALDAYRAFVRKLRYQKWRQAACDPDESTAGISSTVAAALPLIRTTYACRKCGRRVDLAKMRRFPCKKRPSNV